MSKYLRQILYSSLNVKIAYTWFLAIAGMVVMCVATLLGLFWITLNWSAGYTKRFGLYYIDYKNGLARYPKSSVHWFAKILEKMHNDS